MNIILLGPPAAGKGTQAKRIVETRGLAHLSTGAMLRDAIANGSTVGQRAKAVMDDGGLVADEIVIEIVSKRIDEKDCEQGFILDGFPRTLQQADALSELLEEKGKTLDAVVEIQVDDRALVSRIVGRFTCSQCGEGYHYDFKKPASDGICDKCGGTDFQRRSDDTAETLNKRLMEYYKQTSPLIGYYYAKGAHVAVDGMGGIDEISTSIAKVLDEAVVGAKSPSKGLLGSIFG